MKRLIILFMLFVISTGVLFAETAREVSDSPFFEWKFSPTVNTYAGYNLDVGTIGIEGSAELELIATLWDGDIEFTGDSKPYGYIKVEDLLIEATSNGGKGETYDSRSDVDALRLNWGSIQGAIYIGPVYINLVHDGHGDQGILVDNVLGDNDSNPYTVLTYSVLEAKQTASYYLNPALDGISDSTTAGASLDAVASTNNAISIGVLIDNIIDIRLGVATAIGYTEYAALNPLQASLYLELLAVENLNLNLRTTITMNNSDGTATEASAILEKGNPLTVGLEVGYTVPLGDFNLTPALGAELIVENDKAGATDPQNILAYEVGFGVTFDWRDLGIYQDESDYLDAPGRDVEATDGVSLGIAYGALPYVNNNTSVPYLGAQIALWDSESGSKTGIIPGVQLGLILDFNYALGGTVTSGSQSIVISPRADLGALLEASVPLAFVKPYAKVAIRMLNLLGGAGDEIGITADTNAIDLRAKVGVDVSNIVPNTVFQLWWESGDILSDTAVVSDASYNVNADDVKNFYSLKNAVGLITPAQLGFIALGAEISY